MGQIVNVVERKSSNPGVVRFETNRVLSGTGHERYRKGQPVEGDRPVDEIARRLFAHGGVAAVHINGGVITVDLDKGYTSAGMADVIRSLYTYYEATDESAGLTTDADEGVVLEAAAAPEADA
jgi:hypothetical protein